MYIPGEDWDRGNLSQRKETNFPRHHSLVGVGLCASGL